MLTDIFPLRDKTVLVTGASGYLGRHMIDIFHDCGCRLVVFSRTEKVLRHVLKLDREADVYICDNANRNEYLKALHRAVSLNDIDVLINNAYDMTEMTGFNWSGGRILNCTDDTWDAAFKAFSWTIAATQIVGREMKARRSGSIINIGSMYSVVAPDPALYEVDKAYLNPVTYSTMKAGLLGFTRYAASFLGSYGIVVNALCPGPFPDANKVSADHQPFIDELRRRTVVGRTGTPEDLAGPLIMLATTKFMTGQAVLVDGGWTVT